MFQYPTQQECSSSKNEKSDSCSKKVTLRGSVPAHGIPTASTESRVDLAWAKCEGVDVLVAVSGRNDLFINVDGLALAFGIEYYKMLEFADGAWLDVIHGGDTYRMMRASDCVSAVANLAQKQLVTPKLIDLKFLCASNTGDASGASSR